MPIIRSHGKIVDLLATGAAAGATSGRATAEIADARANRDTLEADRRLAQQEAANRRSMIDQSFIRTNELRLTASLQREARNHQASLAQDAQRQTARDRVQLIAAETAGREALIRAGNVAELEQFEARAQLERDRLASSERALNTELAATLERDRVQGDYELEALAMEDFQRKRIASGEPASTLSQYQEQAIAQVDELYAAGNKLKDPAYHVAVGRIAMGKEVPATLWTELYRGTPMDPRAGADPEPPENFNAEETTYFHLALSSPEGFGQVVRVAGTPAGLTVEQQGALGRGMPIKDRQAVQPLSTSGLEARRALASAVENMSPVELQAVQERLDTMPGVSDEVVALVARARYMTAQRSQGAPKDQNQKVAISKPGGDQAGELGIPRSAVDSVEKLPDTAIPLKDETGQPLTGPQGAVTIGQLRAKAKQLGVPLEDVMQRLGLRTR